MFNTLHSVKKLKHSSQHGFTLLELLVAMTLSVILLTGVMKLFIDSTKNANATARISALQETGRVALQIINADIRRVGYLGGNVAPKNISGTLGLSDATKTKCNVNNTAWGRRLEQTILGHNDTKSGYACVTKNTESAGDYLRGDMLTLRKTSSWTIADADIDGDNINANRLYLRTTLLNGKVFKGKDKADALNDVDKNPKNYELQAHTYYIGNSGRTCRGTLIPSLWRMSISDKGKPVSEELLAGVEHLQFRYNVGGQYVDAGDASLNDLSEWSNVTSVEISILVRSECPESSFINKRTFSMGDLATAYGIEDGYRRQLFTGVAALRN